MNGSEPDALTNDPRTDMIAVVPREPEGYDQILTAALLWIIFTCALVAGLGFFTTLAAHH